MSYRVVFSPEAQEQLAELYRYIADAASSDIAARYTEAIVSYCENLRTFPHRGTMRDDIRPGLRITHRIAREAPAIWVSRNAAWRQSRPTWLEGQAPPACGCLQSSGLSCC